MRQFFHFTCRNLSIHQHTMQKIQRYSIENIRKRNNFARLSMQPNEAHYHQGWSTSTFECFAQSEECPYTRESKGEKTEKKTKHKTKNAIFSTLNHLFSVKRSRLTAMSPKTISSSPILTSNRKERLRTKKKKKKTKRRERENLKLW